MVRMVDPQLMARARKAAEAAPSRGGLADRVRKLRFSEFAYRWATEGPENLVAILEDAEHLSRQVRELESRKAELEMKREARAQELLDEVAAYPSLHAIVADVLQNERPSQEASVKAATAIAQAREVARLQEAQGRITSHLAPPIAKLIKDTVSEAVVDIGKLGPAIKAVEFGQELLKLERSIEASESKLKRLPDKLEGKKRALIAAIDEARTDVAAAKNDLKDHRVQATHISAENEQLEHAVSQTEANLRTLASEAKIVTAAVEGQDPAAARRLYHLFREATHYREYRRDAEEAQEKAHELIQKLQELTSAYNELVNRSNGQQARISALEQQNDALRVELSAAQYDRDLYVADLQRCEDDVAHLTQRLSSSQAHARSVSDISQPALVELLKDAGFYTYGDLARATESELLAVPGIGDASVQKIRRSLYEAGLDLKNTWGS